VVQSITSSVNVGPDVYEDRIDIVATEGSATTMGRTGSIGSDLLHRTKRCPSDRLKD
jgi:hypothetical protein